MKTHLLRSGFLLGIGFLFIGSKFPYGKVEDVVYKDFNGNGIDNIYGIGIKRYYFEGEQLVRLAFLDKSGEKLQPDKFLDFFPAEFRYQYDERGKLIKKVAYDPEGNVMDLDGYWDCAITEYAYNENGQLLQQRYFDKEAKPLEMGDRGNALTTYRYDSLGNCTELLDSNAEGELMAPTYALFAYNTLGKLVELANPGLSGEGFYTRFSYTPEGLVAGFKVEQGDQMASYTYTYRDTHLDSVIVIAEGSSLKNVAGARELMVDIDGWKLPDPNLIYTPFHHTGKVLFELSLDRKGVIQDLIPIKDRQEASDDFVQEVYNLLRGVRLHKEKGKVSALAGTLGVEVPSIHPVFQTLAFIKNPVPQD